MDRGQLYLLADELRAIANAGLRWGENAYDRERYERVLVLSARILGLIEDRSEASVLDEYRGDPGRMFPAVGVDAAVVRDGRILLIRRGDDGLWAMPGGGLDVGETVGEGAVRELREETGIEGRATGLIGVWDSRLTGSRLKFHLLHVVMAVDAAGEPGPRPPESTEVGFFDAAALPPLSAGHQVVVPRVLDIIRERRPPHFD